MAKIESLNKEQQEKLAQTRDKWLAAGMSTEPANRAEAEAGVREVYQAAGMDPPVILWAGSPVGCMLACSLLDQVPKTAEDPSIDPYRDMNTWREWAGDQLSQKVVAKLDGELYESIFSVLWQNVGDRLLDKLRGYNELPVIVHEKIHYNLAMEVVNDTGDQISCETFYQIESTCGKAIRDKINGLREHLVRDMGKHKSAFKALCPELVDNIVEQFSYGQHDADFMSLFDFLRNTLGMVEETDRIKGLLKVAENAGWWLPMDGICFISERPSEVHLNENNALHRDGGAALLFPDGFGLYALNGVEVPKWLAILDDVEIDPKEVLKISNVEVRREFLKKVGYERVFSKLGGKTLDKVVISRKTHPYLPEGVERHYELVSIDYGSGPVHCLKMDNPSINAYHLEAVTEDCTTVQQALNYRNGLRPEEIDDENGDHFYQQGDVLLKPIGATKFRSQPLILT